MQFTLTTIDLGVCEGRLYDQGAAEWAVILPGAMLLPDAPLLWFAREAAMAVGRNVLAVWDTFDRTADPRQWVEERAEAALERVADPHPVIIAKSLTTLAAQLAAERRLPAVWLTPLLRTDPRAEMVIAGPLAASAPCLLVGGTADEAWDGDTARSVAVGDVFEVPDADHLLEIEGDPLASIDALRAVTVAVTGFLRTHARGTPPDS